MRYPERGSAWEEEADTPELSSALRGESSHPGTEFRLGGESDSPGTEFRLVGESSYSRIEFHPWEEKADSPELSSVLIVESCAHQILKRRNWVPSFLCPKIGAPGLWIYG